MADLTALAVVHELNYPEGLMALYFKNLDRKTTPSIRWMALAELFGSYDGWRQYLWGMPGRFKDYFPYLVWRKFKEQHLLARGFVMKMLVSGRSNWKILLGQANALFLAETERVKTVTAGMVKIGDARPPIVPWGLPWEKFSRSVESRYKNVSHTTDRAMQAEEGKQIDLSIKVANAANEAMLKSPPEGFRDLVTFHTGFASSAETVWKDLMAPLPVSPNEVLRSRVEKIIAVQPGNDFDSGNFYREEMSSAGGVTEAATSDPDSGMA